MAMVGFRIISRPWLSSRAGVTAEFINEFLAHCWSLLDWAGPRCAVVHRNLAIKGRAVKGDTEVNLAQHFVVRIFGDFLIGRKWEVVVGVQQE